MKKMGTETKVGIFVLLGIIALAVMTVKVRKFHFGKEAGYRVYALFDSAAGVERNSPVRIAGVHVGAVERISLEGGKAKVAFRIPPDVQVYEDAKAYLRSEGLLGERYIEIAPGSEEKRRLRDEEVIPQGAAPVTIDQVLSRLSGIREDLGGVLQPLGQILEGIEPKKIGEMVSNFEAFSRDLPPLVADARDTLNNFKGISAKLEKGEGTLGKLISDEEAYQEIKRTLVAVREVAEKVQRAEGLLGKLISDEEAYQEIKRTLVAVREMAEKVQRGEGTLGKLINDDGAYQDARVTLANLREFSEKLESGEGVLGKLITDEEMGREIEKTMKRVQEAAEGVREQNPVTALGILLGLIF